MIEKKLTKALQNKIKKRFDWIDLAPMSEFSPSIPTSHSWSYMLDMVMWWGIAQWSIVMIAWESGNGKSTVALIAAAEAQKQWKSVLLVDFEWTMTERYCQSLWLDTESAFITQPTSANEWFDLITMMLKEEIFDFIVIDSIWAARPETEIEAESWKTMVGSHPKIVTSAVNKRVPIIRKSWASIVVINHYKVNIDASKYTTRYYPWWSALLYACVTVLVMMWARDEDNKNLYKADEEAPDHFVLRPSLKKSKLPRYFNTCKIKIYPDKGIDKKKDIINAAIKLWVIEQSWAWYSYWEVKAQWAAWLMWLDDSVVDQIEESVKGILKNGKQS